MTICGVALEISATMASSVRECTKEPSSYTDARGELQLPASSGSVRMKTTVCWSTSFVCPGTVGYTLYLRVYPNLPT